MYVKLHPRTTLALNTANASSSLCCIPGLSADLKPENVMLAEPVQPVACDVEEQPEVRRIRVSDLFGNLQPECWPGQTLEAQPAAVDPQPVHPLSCKLKPLACARDQHRYHERRWTCRSWSRGFIASVARWWTLALPAGPTPSTQTTSRPALTGHQR